MENFSKGCEKLFATHALIGPPYGRDLHSRVLRSSKNFAICIITCVHSVCMCSCRVSHRRPRIFAHRYLHTFEYRREKLLRVINPKNSSNARNIFFSRCPRSRFSSITLFRKGTAPQRKIHTIFRSRLNSYVIDIIAIIEYA